ncbi:Disease resistance protein L6 [Linum perenne]
MEQMNMCEETTLSNAFSQSETSVAELQSVVSTLEYEVFLSFRGPDVRKSFADFLYSYLVRSKIRTFRDEEELRKGETIAPSLIQAITESKIYIPILSKSYASSKWCLQELAKMVECCREGNGHIILPVFYFMDPRDVRHQAGPYEEAFEQHSKKHDPIIVQKWRTALQEVGQMKGWHVTEIDGQGAVIDQIFSKVQLHLRSDYTLVTEELIGIDCHVQEVTRLLNLDSGDGKVVGIHGIGGMGKTTIAKAVYDNICTSFNRCCFLENIRELLLKNDGVMALQNKIISRILRDDIQVKDASEGVNIIRERVCKYKVLIVLDDVDDKFEFVQILGKLGNFSSESRFIITTRDKRVLELIQEYKLYEPKEMSSDHSLQLFSMHAFAVHCPPEGYATLCEEFVKVAARLPLALKVIGSLLFCRDKQFWEEKLIELKEVRATSNMVQQRLKISYNELTRTEKIIFLDIACFFIGEDKELPFIMWSDCNLYPESGIRTLVLRSLIKVDERNQFWMHDHLRDLGRGIVIEEDVKHPFKRSRIWSNEDAMNMLENVEAADRVEMLKVSMTWSVHTDNKYFQKLSSLRYLVLEVTPLFGDFSEVLPDMRWLKLSNCFFIPTDLNMKNVVILEIQGCVLTDDWGGWNRVKVAHKLKVINVRGCRGLNRIPDFSQCTRLESIDLTGCLGLKGELNISNFRNLKVVRLQETDITLSVPNLLELKDLEELWFENCNDPPEIPGDIWKLQKLKTLKTVKCSCEGSLLSNQDGTLPSSLTCLIVDWSRGLTRLPNLANLSNLMELRLEALPNLSNLIKLHKYLNPHEPFPDLSRLQNLKQLCIAGWKQLPEVIELRRLKSLRSLEMKACKSLRRLPNLSGLDNLETLDVSGCIRLVDVTGLDRLESLQKLNMSNCWSIEELPDISGMKSLDILDVSECIKLIKVGGLEKLKSLGELRMAGCKSIKKLPDMSQLEDLREINLKGCTQLKASEIHGLGKLRVLEALEISESMSLDHLHGLENLVNLKQLCIAGWKQLPEVIELGRLRSLRSLEMKACMSLRRLPNLSDLDNLETLDVSGCIRLVDVTGLEKLESLQKLNMSNCWSIEELPDISGMKSLDDLNVSECIKLKKVIGLEKLESLTVLSMAGCKSIKKLPDMSQLKVLFEIDLKGCTKLKKVTGLTKLPFLIKVSMDTRLEVQHYLKSLVREGINAVRERM